MNIKNQNNATLSQLGELIKGMRTAMLTYIDGHGSLMSQPMSPLEMDSTGIIWLFADMQSDKIQHLGALNLAFSAEASGTFVSVAGAAELVADKALKQALWTPYIKPWFPKGPLDANLVLLKFIPHTTEYWQGVHRSVL